MIINNELKQFNPNILDKPQIIIANKMDMPSSLSNLEKFKNKVNVDIYPVEAINGNGLKEVVLALAKMLEKIKKHLYMKRKNLRVMFCISLKKNNLLL